MTHAPLVQQTVHTANRLFDSTRQVVSRWAARLHLRRATLCPRCAHVVMYAPRYRRWRICPACGYHFPLTGRARIYAIADARTFAPFDQPRESVIAGTAAIEGQPVVLVVSDFDFHGGTMSVTAGEIIARAFERAAERNLPVVAIVASGGVRIQQGMPALLQMARTIQAVQDFARGDQPFIAILANPVTGGVYASFVNLADVLLAEPGALIGFAGPRVAAVATGRALPADSHHAEAALKNGMIDAIVARDELRPMLAQLASLHSSRPLLPSRAERAGGGVGAKGEFVPRVFGNFVELHGDRVQGDDPKIVGGIAQFDGQAVVVVAQQRTPDQKPELGAGPAGYRKAEHLIQLAGRLNLPVITLVDTPGADPGYESERGGIAGAIARCLAALLAVRVPTVAVIMGEGMSGGAVALAAADRVLMRENATYAVIAPEGASAILYGNASHAEEMKERLGLTAQDLLPRGIIDAIICEPEGDPDARIEAVQNAVRAALQELLGSSAEERLKARRKRYGK